MTSEEIKKHKEKLVAEEKELEEELKKTEGMPHMGNDVDDFSEETDEVEEYATRVGIRAALKRRLNDIRRALSKIGIGSYGKCEKCGMRIEEKVLEADPESGLGKQCKVGHSPLATSH